MNKNMDAKKIADIYNISYLVLYENCPDYILFTETSAIKLIEKIREECFPVRCMEVGIENKNGAFVFEGFWECILEPKETMRMYVKRSCDNALEFIRKMSDAVNRPLFDIDVFDFDHEYDT